MTTTYTKSINEEDLARQMEAMRFEIENLQGEVMSLRTDNEMLKETLIKLTMKLVGVSK